MKKRKRWSWSRWLDALESSSLPEKCKALGREIPPVLKNRSKALAPWELPSSPSYSDLYPLVTHGLLHQFPGVGQFAPIIDPLPEANSIEITDHQRRILVKLRRGGDLRHTAPSPSGRNYGRPGWELRPGGTFSGITMPIRQRAAAQLLKRGLIRWNGCGNWPAFTQRHYRIDDRRIAGVRGFRAHAMRTLNESAKR